MHKGCYAQVPEWTTLYLPGVSDVDSSRGMFQILRGGEDTDPYAKCIMPKERNHCYGNSSSSAPDQFDLLAEALLTLKLIMFSTYGSWLCGLWMNQCAKLSNKLKIDFNCML